MTGAPWRNNITDLCDIHSDLLPHRSYNIFHAHILLTSMKQFAVTIYYQFVLTIVAMWLDNLYNWTGLKGIGQNIYNWMIRNIGEISCLSILKGLLYVRSFHIPHCCSVEFEMNTEMYTRPDYVDFQAASMYANINRKARAYHKAQDHRRQNGQSSGLLGHHHSTMIRDSFCTKFLNCIKVGQVENHHFQSHRQKGSWNFVLSKYCLICFREQHFAAGVERGPCRGQLRTRHLVLLEWGKMWEKHGSCKSRKSRILATTWKYLASKRNLCIKRSQQC